MSIMKITQQGGYINVVLIALIICSVLLASVGGFAVWAFTERDRYKNHSDEEVAKAQALTKEETQAEDAAKYAEEAKNPLKTYVGPAAFGSVTMQYPKTWSAYIIQNEKGANPINGYFMPDIVPNVGEDENSFALRIEVVSQSYEKVLNQYNNEAKAGEITVKAYELPKVPDVIGARIDGQIDRKKQGTLIILPVRNMTLRVWTESNDFKPDLDNIILPNLSFSP